MLQHVSRRCDNKKPSSRQDGRPYCLAICEALLLVGEEKRVGNGRTVGHW